MSHYSASATLVFAIFLQKAIQRSDVNVQRRLGKSCSTTLVPGSYSSGGEIWGLNESMHDQFRLLATTTPKSQS